MFFRILTFVDISVGDQRKKRPGKNILPDICIDSIMRSPVKDGYKVVFTHTTNGGTMLLVNDFAFTVDKQRESKNGTTFYWRCAHRNNGLRCTTEVRISFLLIHVKILIYFHVFSF